MHMCGVSSYCNDRAPSRLLSLYAVGGDGGVHHYGCEDFHYVVIICDEGTQYYIHTSQLIAVCVVWSSNVSDPYL